MSDQKRYALLDEQRRELVIIRRKTEKGIPRCIVCDKPIPRRSWLDKRLGGMDARVSRFFHSNECAIRFAYRVAPDVVKPDPDLDVRVGDRIVAGPLLPHRPRPFEEIGVSPPEPPDDDDD